MRVFHLDEQGLATKVLILRTSFSFYTVLLSRHITARLSELQHIPSSVDGRAALDSAILAANYAKIRRNIRNNLVTAEEDAGDGGPGARSVLSRAE